MSEPDCSMRPAGRVRRLVKRGLRVILLCYLLWVLVLWLLSPRLLFPAGMAGPATAKLDPREGETIWISPKGEDGPQVEGWFVRGAGRTAESPGPLVVFFHGNAELIEHNIELARWYAGRGVSVLMPEYRGYGRSGGSPSQRAIVGDMELFLTEALRRPEVDASKVV